ncbi:MAG: hypothetical protein GW905_02970 [Rhodobacterales bacterium]|nr:hypothetical protein [Rhodobacterales bacterium]
MFLFLAIFPQSHRWPVTPRFPAGQAFLCRLASLFTCCGQQWSRDSEVVASINVRAELGRVILTYRHRSRSDEWKDESYAIGRFASQVKVRRFLERCPHFPKDLPGGGLRPMMVSRLLKKVVYAGYVKALAWGVSVRKGEHEGLISFETHQRILETLEGKARPAARRDFNEDFPLRGRVLCNECGNAMTSAWSKRCHRRGGWRNVLNYPSNSCQALGKYMKMAVMRCVKSC